MPATSGREANENVREICEMLDPLALWQFIGYGSICNKRGLWAQEGVFGGCFGGKEVVCIVPSSLLVTRARAGPHASDQVVPFANA